MALARRLRLMLLSSCMSGSYNGWVKSPAPVFPTYRWLALLLAGLLALGPFLHSHFGASHDTGFHLDGLHALHSSQPAAFAGFLVPVEDSPALGVDDSMTQPESEGLPDLAFVLLIAVLTLLPPLRQPLPRASRAHPVPGALYRPGLPPPCLAPPAS